MGDRLGRILWLGVGEEGTFGDRVWGRSDGVCCYCTAWWLDSWDRWGVASGKRKRLGLGNRSAGSPPGGVYENLDVRERRRSDLDAISHPRSSGGAMFSVRQSRSHCRVASAKTP
jgi:hypothetical protein